MRENPTDLSEIFQLQLAIELVVGITFGQYVPNTFWIGNHLKVRMR